jgi:hypothetical protein
MTLKHALRLDYLCWMALLASVWMGPPWTTKLAISIMIIWNALCITFLSNCISPRIPLANEEILNNECNCNSCNN